MREAPQVLGIVLAGGEGKRLYPLTADRAKPAVPFGGAYRLIDFVLSNLVNARYLRICVLTQYKSHSLDSHISQNWRLSGLAGEYITPVPAQQRLGPRDLSVAEPDLRRGSRLPRGLRRRPRIPDGPRADGPVSHRQRRRGDGGRYPGAPRRGDCVRVFGRRRFRPYPQIRREAS